MEPLVKLAPKDRQERVEDAWRDLILALGYDIQSPHLTASPRRVARFLVGWHTNLDDSPPTMTTFPNEEHYDQMVAVGRISFFSMCVPSRQLVDAVQGQKRAADVSVGDELFTLRDGRVEKTRVITVSSRKTRELVRVETAEGTFEVTPDHPFATEDGWVEAKDLVGKSIEWTMPQSMHRRRFRPVLGYDFGYALGAVFSDGCVGDRDVHLRVTDRAFAERFASALEAAFGAKVPVRECTVYSGFRKCRIGAFSVRIVSAYLADLFRMWAGGDANHMRQHFPRVVLASKDTMQGFLDGYIEGDGSPEPGGGSIIVSGNRPFLIELAEAIDARSKGYKTTGAFGLYVSPRWHQAGWYRKHGFLQEDHRSDLVESRYVEVKAVHRKTAAGRKPFTVYSFTTDLGTFSIGGHLSHNCAHHGLPFYGTAAVGYLPGDRIVGLSKLARVVEHFSHRFQTQEQITSLVARYLEETLKPKGVGVVLKAEHLCMSLRGIEKPGHMTITSEMRGAFRNEDSTRQELLALLG